MLVAALIAIITLCLIARKKRRLREIEEIERRRTLAAAGVELSPLSGSEGWDKELGQKARMFAAVRKF